MNILMGTHCMQLCICYLRYLQPRRFVFLLQTDDLTGLLNVVTVSIHLYFEIVLKHTQKWTQHALQIPRTSLYDDYFNAYFIWASSQRVRSL